MHLSSVIFNQKSRDNEHKGESGYYSNVYFRIGRNGYTGQGWSDERIIDGKWVSERRHKFSEEAGQLFTVNGWSIKNDGQDYVCATATKGKSSLYLHPQSFSGVCENAEIEAVAIFLTDANTFQLRTVDIYEEIYNMPDNTLQGKLNCERAIIQQELLGRFTTKRSNLYITGTNPIESISKLHNVKRLAINGKRSFNGVDRTTDDICLTYVLDVFQELLDGGKFVTVKTKNGPGYRTAKKVELKATDKTVT